MAAGLWITALVVAAALKGTSAQFSFSYEDAVDWPNQFRRCGGKRQSPIDLNSFAVQSVPLPPIRFVNYDRWPSMLKVENSGQNLRVTYECPDLPAISGGGLEETYIFAEYHFHWGSKDSQGSEHTIDGERFPMEVHMIHFNSKYGNMDAASTKPDGLAVLAILFKLSIYDNLALTPILDEVDNVNDFDGKETETETSTNLSAFAALLPPNPQSFYRYRGSLTSPTCNEVVVWTVFQEPAGVSRRQLEQLRTLVDGDKMPISNNFRPTQPTNGRTVYRSTSFTKYRSPVQNSFVRWWWGDY